LLCKEINHMIRAMSGSR